MFLWSPPIAGSSFWLRFHIVRDASHRWSVCKQRCRIKGTIQTPVGMSRCSDVCSVTTTAIVQRGQPSSGHGRRPFRGPAHNPASRHTFLRPPSLRFAGRCCVPFVLGWLNGNWDSTVAERRFVRTVNQPVAVFTGSDYHQSWRMDCDKLYACVDCPLGRSWIVSAWQRPQASMTIGGAGMGGREGTSPWGVVWHSDAAWKVIVRPPTRKLLSRFFPFRVWHVGFTGI